MNSIEKVDNLTGFVDQLIKMSNKENMLDEEMITELINKALFITEADYSKEEIEMVKKDISYRYQIYSDPGQSILADYEEVNWYDKKKERITPSFWSRYKNYLIDVNKFSPNIVSTLGEDTLDQKLMNYILDPDINTTETIIKRGLIIGDVQSGKTSTYIGFLCKAADAGYKVFILLTGTIESLRRQTQERVEEGFIGIDMSANASEGRRVGVGLDNKPIHAMTMTSRNNDFTGNNDKIAVSLSANNDAVVFVIKKNTTTLTKLTDWLVSLNADPIKNKIDLPMLMIDDEADNASINTSASKEDPTKINKLIRKLANVFTKSNYVGFTATPFANVFIDPENTETMENQDLFPEDFIVALPTPSNYVGASKIFAESAEFRTQIYYITDAGHEEDDGHPFYFKHKKEWNDELPNSLTDAIYAFYIVNAIRDLRGDRKAHRSMLINISRFIAVQKYTKLEIEEIHQQVYSSVKYNLSKDFDRSMKDPVLKKLYNTWVNYYSKTEFSWEEISEVLFKAIENIQIKVVNSSKGSEKLEYPKNESLRVIAIGGLALSRGLTLEGLIISYFYRNTSTYDVLMQMGRWFGYRKNYEDLFRIWTHKASADWYAEIADATDKLKDDMSLMRELGQKPRDFGIRVRNNSHDLRITANNKMRNATDEYEFTSCFGGIIETPYLNLDAKVHMHNFNIIKNAINNEIGKGKSFERQEGGVGKSRYIIQDVDKSDIIKIINSIKISRFSSNFITNQISDILSDCFDKSIDKFDIAFIEGTESKNTNTAINICGKDIFMVQRNTCKVDKAMDRLSIGQKGKLGGPADGKAGICDFNGEKAQDIVSKAEIEYKLTYKKENGKAFTDNITYPSDTWFKFIENRKPILLIYLIDVNVNDDECNQKKQIDELRSALNGTPVAGFALGLPKNKNLEILSKTRYKANKIYNWFEQDEIIVESEEE